MIAESSRDTPVQDPAWNALLQQLGGLAPTMAAFTLLHALLTWLGYEFKESTQQLTVLWPAAGLMLAMLILAPWRLWPVFIALQAVVEFSVGSVMQAPFLPGWALLFIVANCIDAIAGALVTRALRFQLREVTVRELLKFVFGCAVGAGVSASLGALVAVESYATTSYLHQLQLWWAGNWLGSLAVAPVVLTWAGATRRIFRSLRLHNVWEVPLILAVMLSATLWVFSTRQGDVASVLQMPTILAALLVTMAFRLPPRWSTLGAAIAIFVAAEMGSRGSGPFVANDTFARILQLQMFLSALALITALVSVFVAQMRITLARLTESDGRYRSFVDLSTEAVWRVELAEPMPLSLPVEAQRAWLNRHAHVAECNVSFDQLEADAVEALVKVPPALPGRPWRREVPWNAIFEDHLAQVSRDNFSMDGLRFQVKSGARARTFLTSFCGVVVEGELRRIWGVARDITEIVDLTTRLQVEKERLKGYARQIMTAEERARRATAVDLHDGIAQSLVGMAMTLEVARDLAPPELQVLLDETRANLRQVQERTRNMIADLSPPGLYELGLCPALQWLAVYFRGHDKLQVELTCRLKEDSVQMDLRVLIFKLVRELLRNVVKHAGVDNARVTVKGDADAVIVDVVDTGRGFEWQMDLFGERVGGFGLWSIADRISEVGGEFKVDTAPGRGARFQLRFPLAPHRQRERCRCSAAESGMMESDSPCSGCAPRLSGCDVRQCEARCCYDGVYLQGGEEVFLRELVSKLPHLAAHVPEDFIVDGYWDGELLGRKTATRPHDYRSPDFPAHFTRTRCVFADAEGFCELEKFARGRGQHPWTFKPTTCWMFPLQEEEGEPEAPVGSPAEDTYRTESYPGYANFVPCGTPVESGKPWREALAGEIRYLEAAPELPLLGSPGRSVDELLAQGRRD